MLDDGEWLILLVPYGRGELNGCEGSSERFVTLSSSRRRPVVSSGGSEMSEVSFAALTFRDYGAVGRDVVLTLLSHCWCVSRCGDRWGYCALYPIEKLRGQSLLGSVSVVWYDLVTMSSFASDEIY
jgi:hypothetical protein